MSYPPEADMCPEEWIPTPKLSDYEAEALLEFMEEQWNTNQQK